MRRRRFHLTSSPPPPLTWIESMDYRSACREAKRFADATGFAYCVVWIASFSLCEVLSWDSAHRPHSTFSVVTTFHPRY